MPIPTECRPSNDSTASKSLSSCSAILYAMPDHSRRGLNAINTASRDVASRSFQSKKWLDAHTVEGAVAASAQSMVEKALGYDSLSRS
jgi:hypothetical protein